MPVGDWGNCVKCGDPLDMHYVAWCPSCEPPKPKTQKVFDFFKSARYVARQEGYELRRYQHRDWIDKVLTAIDVPHNDSYVSITPGDIRYLDDVEDQELKEFQIGLVNHFEVGDDETILLWVSW